MTFSLTSNTKSMFAIIIILGIWVLVFETCKNAGKDK